VGKTVVACALAAWLRRRGCDVGVMKPIATGASRRRAGGRMELVSDDARRLAEAAGVHDPWPLITPVCFAEPLAPWTAARRRGHPIALERVTAAFAQLRRRHEVIVVEGIGGLLVPLGRRLTVADLVKRLGLPVVIVARPGLGTLNHTLLTLEAAAVRGIPVQGVLINWSVPPARSSAARLAERTNPEALAASTSVPVAGRLPWLGARPQPPEALAGWLERHTDPGWLRALHAGIPRVDRVARAVVESARLSYFSGAGAASGG
jgi:dethiobiotin synthetase